MRKTLMGMERAIHEVHHRVKNDLNIILALMGMNAPLLRDETDKRLFRETQNRIRAIAFVHDQLYRSADDGKINCREYLTRLVGNVIRALGSHETPIDFRIETQCFLDASTVITCGIIVNELVTNSMKYAFAPGEAGEISVKLDMDETGAGALEVSDNGSNINRDGYADSSRGFGLAVVRELAEKMGGGMRIFKDSGTRIQVDFLSKRR